MLGKRVPHLGNRAHAVVGQRVDHQRRAGDAIPFVANFLVSDALELAGSALDCPGEFVLGDVAEARLFKRQAQARIHPRVGAAIARRHGHFTNDLRPKRTALRVLAILTVLNVGPLGMAGHGKGAVRKRGASVTSGAR